LHDTGSLVVKSELILRLAGRNPGLHPRDVEKLVDAILDEIITALARGDRVELRGLGSFSARIRGGRLGRNPKTGATVHVPKRKVPYFRQGQKMRKRLNGKAAAAQLSRETGQHSSNL
jgi:integration host factor subunit beta